MHKTRLSLYYLAGYLWPAALLLLTVPDFAMRALLSNADGAYGDVFPRLVGATLLALAILVTQIIRLRLDVLYSTTLAVRLMLVSVVALLYGKTGDPFFLVLVGIIGLGIVLTGSTWLLERRSSPT